MASQNEHSISFSEHEFHERLSHFHDSEQTDKDNAFEGFLCEIASGFASR